MSTDHVQALESSLAELSTVRRTAVDGFEGTLADVTASPAVGTPLPFEGVSLSGTAVELDPSPAELEAAATGVTPAGLAIANYGTVTLRTRPEGDELVSLYPTAHVAVVAASDVVTDMSAAIERLDGEFEAGADTQILATGPSATGDMGGLVRGVHGPKETHVIVLEDR